MLPGLTVTDLPGSSDGEESACNEGDPGFLLGSGRCPGGGNGNPLHCSCLEFRGQKTSCHVLQTYRHISALCIVKSFMPHFYVLRIIPLFFSLQIEILWQPAVPADIHYLLAIKYFLIKVYNLLAINYCTCNRLYYSINTTFVYARKLNLCDLLYCGILESNPQYAGMPMFSGHFIYQSPK